jgi:sterol desaturase/sphingolipid hydroxylase (fatty acid hydroxylase superfamily)
MSNNLTSPSLVRPAGPQLRLEARKARRRFYPSTILYSGYALTLLVLGLRSARPLAAVAWFLAGALGWTLMEYFVHRFVLHGRFPDGPGPYRRFTHKYFDPLHWEHHARPWDGNHINGSLRDTLHFAVVLAGLSYLAPFHTAPMFIAGLLQAYVVEEWVHHSVHFYHFKNRYFRYIRRHHLYHHSPRGMNAGYGLTNGFWDIVWKTRFPAEQRRALYSRARRARAAARHDSAGVPPAA